MIVSGLLLGGYYIANANTGDFGLLMVTLKLLW